MNNWQTPIRLRVFTQAMLTAAIGSIGATILINLVVPQFSVGFAIILLGAAILALAVVEIINEEAQVNRLLRNSDFHWIYTLDEFEGFTRQSAAPSLRNRRLGLITAAALGIVYVLIGLQVSVIFLGGSGLFFLLGYFWYVPPAHSGNMLIPSRAGAPEVFVAQDRIYQVNASKSYRLPKRGSATAAIIPGKPPMLRIRQRIQGTIGTTLEWQIAIPAKNEADVKRMAERYQPESE